jgi:outer membrane lipoprotein-sorting protein
LTFQSIPREPSRAQAFCAPLLFGILVAFPLFPLRAQPDANAQILQKINASVQAREQGLLGYSASEEYRVYRNHDETHPVAEMLVKTTYQKDVGKNYTIVSLTGSELMHRVLETILENEKRINQPAIRAGAIITPANYEMSVKGNAVIDGRNCVELSLKPRHPSEHVVNGKVWVDARDGSIVQLEGITARSPSIFAGASQVSRQYTMIDGFAMATHARAVSNSWLVGQTVITIDYSNYQMQLQASK